MPKLTVLDNFGTANGSTPSGGPLHFDAVGNLYGTTFAGGAGGNGVVYEIPLVAGSYASTPTVLSSLSAIQSGSKSSVVADANGNLFGTSTGSNAQGLSISTGAIFEVAKTPTGYASVATTLSNLDGTNNGPQMPQGNLLIDSAGDLFGTSTVGGQSSSGTVFELVHGSAGYSATPTVLASLNSTSGASPAAGLITDAAGDLFGVASSGGSGSDGTVFEIAKTASGYAATPTTLVNFNSATGNLPEGELVADAAGDLFGTTTGILGGSGTVFEIVKTATGYQSTPITLVSFTGPNGATPEAGLIIDSKGDLFGTTEEGGASGDGTVFEITNGATGYATVPTMLATFSGANGEFPLQTLVADGAGNLFGTTSAGGSSNLGTVFEITDSGFAVACYCPGTLILTDAGEVPVEALQIGDHVITLGGRPKPVKWIGRRAYAGPFIEGRRDVLPVCMRAGSLGEGLPRRDLVVSPLHAMFLDGVLVPAGLLVNGVSVTQAQSVVTVEYIHVELDEHAVIWAEGAASESFVDDNSRGMFQNVHEFVALYPGNVRVPAVYCAPRVEHGERLVAIKDAIDALAGVAPFRTCEPLRGVIDGSNERSLWGWAQNPDKPEVPVCLEVLVGGVVIQRTLANTFRPDLRAAGIGSGRHSFNVALPENTHGRSIEVRRVADGAIVGRLKGRSAVASRKRRAAA